MKIEIETKEGSTTILNIEIPSDTVKKEEDSIYNELTKTAKVPGFRIGKVPKNILIARYKQEVQTKVIEQLISSTYSSTLKEKNLIPLGEVKIDNINFKENSPLSFKIMFEVAPLINLCEYKGIELEKEKFRITDKEINKTLENLQDQKATLADVNNRPIKKDDYVIIDYQGFVDNVPVEQEKANNQFIAMGSSYFNKEINDGLIGVSVNEEKEIPVLLPSNYKIQNLQNKNCVYKVKVKSIKEKILPEINDEFVTSFGEYKTVDELKEGIKQNLIKSYEKKSKKNVENKILDYLCKNIQADLPKSMVEDEIRKIENDMKKTLLQLGYKEEDILAKVKDEKEIIKEHAEKNVKSYFILKTIGQQENINVTEQEINEKIVDIALRLKKLPEEIKKDCEQNGYIKVIENEILFDKIIDFLISSSKIKIIEKGIDEE